MIFWTFLLAALFTMSLLYVLWGPKKIWGTLVTYGAISSGSVLLIYYQFHGLFTLDLISLVIPYLFVVPLHFSVHNIIKHYVLHDDMRTSIFFVAIFNRILIALWGLLLILLIGIGLAILDGFVTQFDPQNIWSISVTGILAVLVFVAIVSVGYRKRFTYVLVVGKTQKKVYELNTSKSRLIVKNYIKKDKVYPRGIYQEFGMMKYLYYVDSDLDMNESKFQPIESDLFDYLKDYIESYETLEEAYNEYIEQKNSIL